MVLDLTGGLFKQSDVRETAVADLTSGERVPVGAIIAWLKHFTGTPSLPSGFVECSGQVLNDGESVYDGETIPNLNGNDYFLRGATVTGGTGGDDSHVHTTDGHILTVAEMPEHRHTAGGVNAAGAGAQTSIAHDLGATDHWYTSYAGSDNSHAHGDTGSHSSRPKYYNVMWIMRVK